MTEPTAKKKPAPRKAATRKRAPAAKKATAARGPARKTPSVKPVSVLIVGAGFAGLGMAIRLKQAGINDFVILERGNAVGGTWRDNQYPGAACDIPSNCRAGRGDGSGPLVQLQLPVSALRAG